MSTYEYEIERWAFSEFWVALFDPVVEHNKVLVTLES